MGDVQEGEDILHPVFALQAAVVSVPSVSMHLATPMRFGAHRDVLLSMSVIKMKPLSMMSAHVSTEVAALLGDGVTCHLLIMGHKSLDQSL